MPQTALSLSPVTGTPARRRGSAPLRDKRHCPRSRRPEAAASSNSVAVNRPSSPLCALVRLGSGPTDVWCGRGRRSRTRDQQQPAGRTMLKLCPDIVRRFGWPGQLLWSSRGWSPRLPRSRCDRLAARGETGCVGPGHVVPAPGHVNAAARPPAHHVPGAARGHEHRATVRGQPVKLSEEPRGLGTRKRRPVRRSSTPR
jgi:hypothetical protein